MKDTHVKGVVVQRTSKRDGTVDYIGPSGAGMYKSPGAARAAMKTRRYEFRSDYYDCAIVGAEIKVDPTDVY